MGENSLGQLGDGTETGPSTCSYIGHDSEVSRPCSATPVALSGLSGVTAISAGGSHTLALLSDGTVMAWGANGSGQLGNGSTKNSHVPVAVSGLSGVSAIAAAQGVGAGAGSHSLALLGNGTVMAWGSNNEGQLGDGSTTSSTVPVPVSGLSGAAAVAAGEQSSVALLGDGTVMSWGTDSGGVLGVGGRAEPFGGPDEELPYSDVPFRCAPSASPRRLCAGLARIWQGSSRSRPAATTMWRWWVRTS